MKKYLIIILTVIITPAWAEQIPQPPQKGVTMQQKMRERFTEIDKNNDQILMIEEVKENHAANFAKLDVDANHAISQEEFVVLSTKEDEKVDNAQFQKMLISLRALKVKNFKKMDTDRNNQVSEAEFMKNAEEFFQSLDSNQDGKITVEEWDQQSKRN